MQFPYRRWQIYLRTQPAIKEQNIGTPVSNTKMCMKSSKLHQRRRRG